MARIDRVFGRLALNLRSKISDWYKGQLFETRRGFEGTPHVLWAGWVGPYGYPAHKVGTRLLPLNGYLLFVCENFQLSGDEFIVARCGVKKCVQTAHMQILLKTGKVSKVDKHPFLGTNGNDTT